MESGTLAFGLLNFFGALVQGTGDFLERLATDPELQKNTLARYDKLKRTAKPSVRILQSSPQLMHSFSNIRSSA
jgi:hypothetical protein